VDLIKNGQEQEALRVLQYLRGENYETTTIRDDFDEMKIMTIEDKPIESGCILSDGNIRPLMFTLLLKISFVLSFNCLLNSIRLRLVAESIYLLFWLSIPG
jgi:hypothetical protein